MTFTKKGNTALHDVEVGIGRRGTNGLGRRPRTQLSHLGQSVRVERYVEHDQRQHDVEQRPVVHDNFGIHSDISMLMGIGA